MGTINTQLESATRLEDGKLKVACRFQTSPASPWYDVCEEVSVEPYDTLRGIVHRAVLVHLVRRA